jgi:hypothetical protein
MTARRVQLRRVAIAALFYLLAYCLASCLDLWTTVLALKTSGAHEGNAFATSGAVYLSGRALLINVVGGLIMTGCVIFSANYADRVENRWLLHPLASCWIMHLNPWSPAAMGVSPLQMLSLALGFVAMRLIAAGNNLLIYFYGFAPIGSLISAMEHHASAVIAFAVVIVPLFCVLAIAASPVAAKLIASWLKAVHS